MNSGRRKEGEMTVESGMGPATNGAVEAPLRSVVRDEYNLNTQYRLV